MNLNNIQGPPPAGPTPQNHNGPPGLNLQMSAPDLRTMEGLCQPMMNGRGRPIAPVNIQATDFGLKNHMIQQVQNSCQFQGLPGDDANKHLDKLLTITQNLRVMVPLSNLIAALAVVRNGVLKMKGLFSPFIGKFHVSVVGHDVHIGPLIDEGVHVLEAPYAASRLLLGTIERSGNQGYPYGVNLRDTSMSGVKNVGVESLRCDLQILECLAVEAQSVLCEGVEIDTSGILGHADCESWDLGWKAPKALYGLRPLTDYEEVGSGHLDDPVELQPQSRVRFLEFLAGREFLEKSEHFSPSVVDLLALLENGVLKSFHSFGIQLRRLVMALLARVGIDCISISMREGCLEATLALMVVESEVLNDFPRFVGILIAEFAVDGRPNVLSSH
ncbi:hypothetical protein Tco_0844986 [Tanacetum coccineum]